MGGYRSVEGGGDGVCRVCAVWRCRPRSAALRAAPSRAAAATHASSVCLAHAHPRVPCAAGACPSRDAAVGRARLLMHVARLLTGARLARARSRHACARPRTRGRAAFAWLVASPEPSCQHLALHRHAYLCFCRTPPMLRLLSPPTHPPPLLRPSSAM